MRITFSNEILHPFSIIKREIKRGQFLPNNLYIPRNVNFELYFLAGFQKAKEGCEKHSLKLLIKSVFFNPEKILSKSVLAAQRQILYSIFR